MKLGEKIKDYRKKNGLTLRDFAQRCGTSHSYISMLEDGKNSKTGEPITPSISNLKKIAIALGMSLYELVSACEDLPADIFSGTVMMLSEGTTVKFPVKPGDKSVRIPVYGSVAAGIPLEAIQDIDDYEEISLEMACSASYAALRIKGDSMLPRFAPGDVVIVKLQKYVDNGDIAIVFVNGDEATCKKIKKTPEGVMLISTNPEYEPMFYTNQEISELPVRIWGKVVELRAKF